MTGISLSAWALPASARGISRNARISSRRSGVRCSRVGFEEAITAKQSAPQRGVSNAALDLIRERYLDFGPTLAREKLIELHHISLAKETLRQWMTEAGIWVSRRERKKRVFQPRGRRDCFGELVQIDGSHHWWLSNRIPSVKLI